MNAELDQLLTRYENGHVSRRELLTALVALVAAGPTANEAAAPAIGQVKSMNHVSIFVPSVQKSKEFYQSLLGLPLLTNQDPGVNLSTGASFLGIYPAPSGATKGSINHLCLGIDRFDADAVLKALTDRGLQARIRLRDDAKELYLMDPDGISVQLQDTSYIGGVGPLGNQKP